MFVCIRVTRLKIRTSGLCDLYCCYNVVIINNDADVTALITLSETRKEIVVTYRGTQNVFNAVLGATMFNVCYDTPECDIRLHLGLYISTMAIYQTVT